MDADAADAKDFVREPEGFVILWPGRPSSPCRCDAPRLARFAVVHEVRQRPDSLDDLHATPNLVPTPVDLAPWLMRLPEFVCHFCQGRAVRGTYFFQFASLDRTRDFSFCPKEYAVATMGDITFAGVQPDEFRRRVAMHLAKTVLGVEIVPSQVTALHSGVYDVTVVWESHAPAECSAARTVWETRDRIWSEWQKEPAFKAQVELWQAVEPEIDTAIRRVCRKRRRGVALGVFHGVPALCLECVPVGLVKNECPEVCWRHPLILGAQKGLFEQSGLEANIGLLATCAQMFEPVMFASTPQKSSGADDYSAPLDRDRLLNGAPGFGTGVPFTVSGVIGRHYEISETNVDRRDTSAAVELLHKMLNESVRTGWLHHFHTALAFGRFNEDPRPAAEIPEVANWVRLLNEQFPALWFFLDPDSLSWVYPAIHPEAITETGVYFDRLNYARLCVRATTAAAELLRACGCRADRLDSLLFQAANIKNTAAASHFQDVQSAARSQLEDLLSRTDIPKRLLGRIGGRVSDLAAGWVSEKAAASYTDGQVHAAGVAGMLADDCPGSYLTFSFFPCSTQAAQDAYRRSGGYMKFLGRMRSDPAVPLSALRDVDMLVHLVVCHESLLNYAFHLSFLPWQAEEPAFLAHAFQAGG